MGELPVAPQQAPLTDREVNRLRDDFPILRLRPDGHPLVYLDNAATSQKPQRVIDTIARYYTEENANIHRGLHYLSEIATARYEAARETIRKFLNAASLQEIIFVRGATEAVNLAAQSFARPLLKSGDEILISTLEHHSNIVPWQLVCEQTGAALRVIPVNDRGELMLDECGKLLSERTKLVALTQVSNAVGTVTPVQTVIRLAHEVGAKVLIDGAQSVPHMPVDVRAMDCDFFVFSGHKLFGPTGIGVLYGKESILDRMPPYHGGGDMIKTVSFEKTTYNDLPYKFEAGTPHVEGVIGLGEAVTYVQEIGLDRIMSYEQGLLRYATERLSTVDGLRIIGQAERRAGIVSFVLDAAHAQDVGAILDRYGVAVRSGHHCAMPLMARFGLTSTTRASLAFYNTREEIDTLVTALKKSVELLA